MEICKMADDGRAIGSHWIRQGNMGQGNSGAGPPPVGRGAVAAQSKVVGLVHAVGVARAQP
jgi:hypothetical protein